MNRQLLVLLIILWALGLAGFAAPVRADLFVNNSDPLTGLPGQIVRYDETTGAFLGVFAQYDDGVGIGLTFGPDGNLYATDEVSGSGNRVVRFDGRTGAFLGTFASDPGLNVARDLIFGPDGNLYVSSLSTGSVLRFDGVTGASLGTFATSPDPVSMESLTFGPDGNLYVVNRRRSTARVLRFDGRTGALMDVFASGGGLLSPTGLTFGPDGNLYVGHHGFVDQDSLVSRFDGRTGAFLGTFATGAGETYLARANLRLAFGPDRNLYVSNSNNNNVLRFNGTTGAFIDVFAAGPELNFPTGLAFTPRAAAVVPEPGTCVLFASGLLPLAGIVARRRWRR